MKWSIPPYFPNLISKDARRKFVSSPQPWQDQKLRDILPRIDEPCISWTTKFRPQHLRRVIVIQPSTALKIRLLSDDGYPGDILRRGGKKRFSIINNQGEPKIPKVTRWNSIAKISVDMASSRVASWTSHFLLQGHPLESGQVLIMPPTNESRRGTGSK